MGNVGTGENRVPEEQTNTQILINQATARAATNMGPPGACGPGAGSEMCRKQQKSD